MMTKVSPTHADLDRMADKIEGVLRANKMMGRVNGGTVADGFIRFDLVTQAVKIAALLALAEEFSIALGSQCTVDKLGSGATVTIKKQSERPTLAKMLQTYKNRIPANAAGIGYDSNGAPLMIQFAKSDVSSVVCVGGNGRLLVTTIYQCLKALGNDMSKYLFVDLDKTAMPDTKDRFLVACTTQPTTRKFAVTLHEKRNGWQLHCDGEVNDFEAILTETKQQTERVKVTEEKAVQHRQQRGNYVEAVEDVENFLSLN